MEQEQQQWQQQEPGDYRPSIQENEQRQRFFANSIKDAELMTIDECETMRELDDLQHGGGLPTATPAVASGSVVSGGMVDVNSMIDVEVRAAVKPMDVTTVKRKRGRPPRNQGKTAGTQPPPPKRKSADDEEDVCFICFDGGSLVLCDRRGCPKAYHPSCIKRDESFFRSKAKWNCGWHICSSCQKSSYYMCYTCTYSLCKGCTKDADYVCIRGNKGLCGTCMRTIMLIENITPGNTETVQVDFDDKTSWEYLFKIYWIFLKAKLSLTVDELTKAKNPWKGDELTKAKNSWKGFGSIVASKEILSSELYNGIDDKGPCLDNCYGNVEANQAKRRKTNDQTDVLNKQNSPVVEVSAVDKVTPLAEGTTWATKELLEFVSHMRHGDTSMLYQFDVQTLLLEYVKRNNLRDPCQKSQIICDSRLINLFGKSRVGHFEMLKLLEYHFLIKEKSPANDSDRLGVADAVGSQIEAAGSSDNQMIMGSDKRRKSRKKMDERGPQINLNLDEYAAIDVHNINLLYLKCNLMENLMDDIEKFHEKVVGSFVRIRILGGDQKQDMYRLVQVVGTTKVAESYKVGSRTTDVMLEILNLDKKEVIPIDGISNQEFSEDECRRLRQSIKCGLFKRLKVGEIQEKALALHPVKVSDWLEAEISRHNHLRDRASEKGLRKDLREYVEKLDLLKSPKERQRRLLEIPNVHMDSSMDPSYESDEDAGESAEMKKGDHTKSRSPGFGRKGLELNSPLMEGDLNDAGNRLATASEQSRNVCTTFYVDKDGPKVKVHERVSESKWHQGGGTFGLNNHHISKDQLGPTVSVTCDWNSQAVRCESHSGVASAVVPSFLSLGRELSLSDIEADKLWHYQDPYGKVQGPFAMMQLRKWSTSGLFPPNLRVWRIDKKQDDSILLTDALVGQCPKGVIQPCNSHLLSQEAAGASNDPDKKLEHVFSQSTDVVMVDSKRFDHDLKLLHKDKTVNADGDGDLVKSNSLGAHSSMWTKPVDVAITKDGQAQNFLQGWEMSKGLKLYETPLSQAREGHRDEKRCSHPGNADGNSHKTMEDQTTVREVDEKRAESEDHSSQSCGQNWRPQPIDSSPSGWDSNTGHVSMTKSSEKSEQNQQKHEELKGQAENKLSNSSNAPVQDSGPSWSTTSNLVVRQLREVAGEWGGFSSAPKPSIEEWDSNLVPASSLKPTEVATDHAAAQTSGGDKLMNSSLPHPAIDTPNWQPLVPEPNDFCSLADESVSDLLAEVEAMESLGGLPSPTSKMSCGGELTPGSDNDCFSPIEPFSPALDPGKSDALSSTSDMQMPSQYTAASVLLRLSLMPSQPTLPDEPLAASQMPSQLTVTDKPHQASQMPSHSTAPDGIHRVSQMRSQSALSEEPLGLWRADALDSQKSFSGHSSSSAEVEGDTKPSDVSVNQWDTRSEIQPLASSTVNQGEAGSDAQASTPSTVSQLEVGSDTQHPLSSTGNTSWGTVKESTNLNQGAVSQGSTNMVWGTGHGSIQQQVSTTSAISTGNMGSWGNQPRYGGDNRYSGPRDYHRNYYQNRDSGFGRDRSSWNRQPTYGNGGGSFKPPGKGQRVCKFYESGYCKKGASCTYLHP